jgi:pilus assembly protein Flp/PilA
MNNLLIKLHIKFRELTSREEGQDMVEYALVVGLIAFGATGASKFLAAGLSTAFSNISSNLASYVG